MYYIIFAGRVIRTTLQWSEGVTVGPCVGSQKRCERQLSSRFYVVAVGRREDIFSTWDDANKQVFRYSGEVYKSFKTLEEAFIFLYENRLTPPGAREMWSFLQDTPKPNTQYEEAYLTYWRQKERQEESQEEFDG